MGQRGGGARPLLGQLLEGLQAQLAALEGPVLREPAALEAVSDSDSEGEGEEGDEAVPQPEGEPPSEDEDDDDQLATLDDTDEPRFAGWVEVWQRPAQGASWSQRTKALGTFWAHLSDGFMALYDARAWRAGHGGGRSRHHRIHASRSRTSLAAFLKRGGDGGGGPGPLLPARLVALDGCTCRPVSVLPQGECCFELWSPGDDAHLLFNAASHEERLEWIAGVQGASHLELHALQAELRAAGLSREAYLACLSRELRVPVAWMHRNTDALDDSAKRRRALGDTMAQVARDFERDNIVVDGRLFRGREGVEAVVSFLTQQVLRAAGGQLAPSNALHFAVRCLRGSSRTQAGGDIFDAASFLFATDGVLLTPQSIGAQPISLSVYRRRGRGRGRGGRGGFVVCVVAQTQMRFSVVPLDDVALLDQQPGVIWSALTCTLTRTFRTSGVNDDGHVDVAFEHNPERAEGRRVPGQ